MGDPKVPPIGPRIRAERARREVTIRALARVVGVSPSLISQIETGKSQPSVSTLYGITSTLGLSLEDLFDASDTEASAGLARDADQAALAIFASDRTKGVGPHVSPDDRELLTLESGVTWERLGQVPHHHVDFLLVTYQPGSTSSSEGRLMRHSGTEYAYLISGELELCFGIRQVPAGSGGLRLLRVHQTARLQQPRGVPAVGVWFVVEPS